MSHLHTFGPAKINLYLHITGKRADGYHLLDSLVVFTHVGDEVRLEPSQGFSFAVQGPMAAGLGQESINDNLVVRAAHALAEACAKKLHVKLTLIKNLPIASGIGGGSSDAAATLRLLARYWGMAANDPLLYQVASGLGADIPCCIAAESCYFRDIGNVTDPAPALPHMDIVLVNPNKSLPTPAVYKAREGAFNIQARLSDVPDDARALAAMLKARDNDLTEAACGLMPDIRDVLMALEQSAACLLARMSGSGATCFGIYANRSEARQAAADIFKAHPDWWVVPTYAPYHLRHA